MNVLIYADEGVSQNSLSNTRAALSDLLSESYDIKPVSAQTLAQEPWEGATSLLVFPGGRDLPYCAKLAGAPNAKIKRWVQQGGKYLGLCAGAYYGSQRVEFELGTPLEVVGDRELDFFPGLCRGAAFPGFVYNSEAGARNAQLSLDASFASTSASVYWNGGGWFETAATSTDSVRVLARYAELPNQPAAIVASSVGQGTAVLSSPHPEHPLVGQSQYAREMLRKLLQLLALQVSSANAPQTPQPTSQYLLSARPGAAQEVSQRILAAFEGQVDQPLQDAADKFSVCSQADALPAVPQTSTASQDDDAAVRQIIPCSSSSLPSIAFFTPQDYLSQLKTKSIGQPLLYAEVVTSTQTLLDKNPRLLSALPSGLISVATRQISGRGRGGNAWLSPEGCLMFSLVLRAPPSLAAKLVFVQYLIALAAVQGLEQALGVEGARLGLCIKWPNDLYADLGAAAGALRYQKIGGILVNNSFAKGSFTLVVGCGINLSNLRPTLSVNSLVERVNATTGISRAPFAPEEALAAVMNTFEPMWDEFVSQASFDPFLDQYLASWIHRGQIITLEASGQKAEILGISLDHGFLITSLLDGSRQMIELQPDGNSFDMLQGLIKRKT